MKRKVLSVCILFSFVAILCNAQTNKPTKEELAGLDKLKTAYFVNPSKVSDVELQKARDYVASCNISYKDGIATGVVLGIGEKVDKSLLLGISTTLNALASSSVEADKKLCRIFIDYILAQGVAEGIDFVIPYNDYSTVRNLPKGYFASLAVATDKQKEELLKFMAWILEYKKVKLSESEYLSKLNADGITNVVQHYFTYAVSQPKPEVAIENLKLIVRYLNRHTEYVPGEKDMLKIDGTGFHHKTHYNNYMYAYDSWIKMAYNLKGTLFRVDLDAFKRMRKATIAMYLMATRSKNDTRYTANSLSGRNPYGKNGVKVQVPKASFKKLVEIGGDLQNEAFDKELAAAYNFFFMTDEYKVEAVNYDGFYQFNYSPAGIYRGDNWVVTMRSPTTKFWGAEIYNKTNRFGRYQSHGSLEVMYEGSLVKSGCPNDDMSGGWDWNVIPGTTTVHYTSWKDMMPLANTAQRFDQYTKTTNFAGALSMNQMGIFAADFDQIDKWGKQTYEPTNLVFRKSVFAIENMLFCMGSNISASGNYEDDMITATNLFQSIKYPVSGKLIMDSNAIDEGYDDTLNSDKSHWFITPQSTGYIIPKGNDKLILKYGKQTSPKQTGEDVEKPETVVTAAKAYLDHGVKTSNKGYFFIVMPNVKEDAIRQMADVNVDKNDVFEILRQDSVLHILNYKPKKATAYSIFAPNEHIDTGLLKGSATQLLLIVKEESPSHITIAVCNPNLNPVADSEFGWRSSPTEASIVLKGRWQNVLNNENIKLNRVGEDTKVNFTLQDGEPLYFDLKK